MRKQNIVNRRSVLEAAGDYRTKATLGITGWFRLRVHIDGGVRHLDVGSTYPGAGEGPKGLAVRQLKCYVSWVQTVQSMNAQASRVLYRLNPIENFSIYEIKIEPIKSRRSKIIFRLKLTYIGEILKRIIPRETERYP